MHLIQQIPPDNFFQPQEKISYTLLSPFKKTNHLASAKIPSAYPVKKTPHFLKKKQILETENIFELILKNR